MNKTIETQGKTIEGAIDEALKILGASYDEVDVDIIQEAGFLKKAKIKVTLKSSAAAEKPLPEPKITKEEIKETKKEDKKEQKEEKKEEKKEQKKDKKEKNYTQGELPKKFKKTLDFTAKLLELLGSSCEVTHEITDKSFNINVSGTGAGQIIGKGGEVLNAIQTLISSIAIANSDGENMRVYFNVEDYKERRIETLKALAVRKAEKVKETGRFIKLEPMNARDRAIIHSTLQEIHGIRTYSTGKEPHRCLCIAPARKEEQE